MAKWIAGAIKHPGLLHRVTGTPEGQNIPADKLGGLESRLKKSGKWNKVWAGRLGLARRAKGGM